MKLICKNRLKKHIVKNKFTSVLAEEFDKNIRQRHIEVLSAGGKVKGNRLGILKAGLNALGLAYYGGAFGREILLSKASTYFTMYWVGRTISGPAGTVIITSPGIFKANYIPPNDDPLYIINELARASFFQKMSLVGLFISKAGLILPWSGALLLCADDLPLDGLKSAIQGAYNRYLLEGAGYGYFDPGSLGDNASQFEGVLDDILSGVDVPDVGDQLGKFGESFPSNLSSFGNVLNPGSLPPSGGGGGGGGGSSSQNINGGNGGKESGINVRPYILVYEVNFKSYRCIYETEYFKHRHGTYLSYFKRYDYTYTEIPYRKEIDKEFYNYSTIAVKVSGYGGQTNGWYALKEYKDPSLLRGSLEQLGFLKICGEEYNDLEMLKSLCLTFGINTYSLKNGRFYNHEEIKGYTIEGRDGTIFNHKPSLYGYLITSDKDLVYYRSYFDLEDIESEREQKFIKDSYSKIKYENYNYNDLDYYPEVGINKDFSNRDLWAYRKEFIGAYDLFTEEGEKINEIRIRDYIVKEPKDFDRPSPYSGLSDLDLRLLRNFSNIYEDRRKPDEYLIYFYEDTSFEVLSGYRKELPYQNYYQNSSNYDNYPLKERQRDIQKFIRSIKNKADNLLYLPQYLKKNKRRLNYKGLKNTLILNALVSQIKNQGIVVSEEFKQNNDLNFLNRRFSCKYEALGVDYDTRSVYVVSKVEGNNKLQGYYYTNIKLNDKFYQKFFYLPSIFYINLRLIKYDFKDYSELDNNFYKIFSKESGGLKEEFISLATEIHKLLKTKKYFHSSRIYKDSLLTVLYYVFKNNLHLIFLELPDSYNIFEKYFFTKEGFLTSDLNTERKNLVNIIVEKYEEPIKTTSVIFSNFRGSVQTINKPKYFNVIEQKLMPVDIKNIDTGVVRAVFENGGEEVV